MSILIQIYDCKKKKMSFSLTFYSASTVIKVPGQTKVPRKNTKVFIFDLYSLFLSLYASMWGYIYFIKSISHLMQSNLLTLKRMKGK